MKKVWYLESEKQDGVKIAKLFLYDKNDGVEAWLDLSSFAAGAEIAGWEIVFLTSAGQEAGRLQYTGGDAFIQDALHGKGKIPMEAAERLRRQQKTLEICVKADNKVYASDTGLYQAPSEEPDLEEGYLDEEQPYEEQTDEGYPDITEQPAEAGRRRIVELGVLEDEMLFRAYVHNSFLLHGYYNYGHLVLDEQNGRSRLGVPGNYYEREEIVAGMFGFPDFEPEKGKMKQTGVFGYYFTKG